MVYDESENHTVVCRKVDGNGDIAVVRASKIGVNDKNGHKNIPIDVALIELAIDCVLVTDVHIVCTIHGPL